MIGYRTALAALLIAAAAPSLALAQSVPAPQGPITNLPNIVTPPVPDLVITKADATVTCVGGSQVTATIAVTVLNIGKATADMSIIPVALEARWHGSGAENMAAPIMTVKPQLAINKLLKPGDSYSNSLIIDHIPEYKKSAPKKAQFYVFEVWADPLKQLPEGNEKNNAGGENEMDPCPK